MIKEKYMPLITSLAIFLALAFTITVLVVNNNSENSSIIQPDYMTKLFNEDTVLDIDISVDEDNWNNLLENATDQEYIPCDISINGEKVSTAGIRAKGNSSLTQVANDDTTDRYSFKVDFSQYVSDQSFYGLTDLALNNMIGDPSYMKEYLSYDLMEKMGVNTPGKSFANIKINGEDWGLYLAVEVMKEDFLERTYGTNYGNLYKPESNDMGNMAKSDNGMKDNPNKDMKAPNGNASNIDMPSNSDTQMPPNNTISPDSNSNEDVDNIPDMPSGGNKNGNMDMPNGKGGMSSGGTDLVYTDDNISSYSKIFDYTVTKGTDDSDKKKIIEMMKALSEGENLEDYLDIDEILRYFAVNTFLVNLDSYAGSMKHNYYLYEKDGVCQILPWDFNLSFGSFQMNDSSKVINFPIDTPVTDSMENSPLISKLLEVDEYKELYHNYLNDIVNTYINSGYYEKQIEKLNKLISSYVKNDATAFYTYDEYAKSISELKTFGQDRAKSITAQLKGEQPSTSYGNIETTLNLSALGSMGKGGNNNMPPSKDNMSEGDNGFQNNNIMPPPDANMNEGNNRPQNNDIMPPNDHMNQGNNNAQNINYMNATNSMNQSNSGTQNNNNMPPNDPMTQDNNRNQNNMNPNRGMNPQNIHEENIFSLEYLKQFIPILFYLILMASGTILVKKFKRKKYS